MLKGARRRKEATDRRLVSPVNQAKQALFTCKNRENRLDFALYWVSFAIFNPIPDTISLFDLPAVNQYATYRCNT